MVNTYAAQSGGCRFESLWGFGFSLKGAYYEVGYCGKKTFLAGLQCTLTSSCAKNRGEAVLREHLRRKLRTFEEKTKRQYTEGKPCFANTCEESCELFKKNKHYETYPGNELAGAC